MCFDKGYYCLMFAVKLANTSASDMVAGISGLFSHNPLMVSQRKLATNALSQLPPKETLIWVRLQRQRKTGHVVGDEGWGGACYPKFLIVSLGLGTTSN